MVIVENKQTNKTKQTTIFKKRKDFDPKIQNLNGRSVLDKFFFENDPLDELNMIGRVRNFFTVPNNAQMPEKWPNSPPLYTSKSIRFFPFKKGF